jgi:glycosyltransferase involved in cell wall biosynthesis
MLIGIDARYGFRKIRRGIGCYIYNLLQAFEKMESKEKFILYVDGLAEPELINRFSKPPFMVSILTGSNLFYWEQVLLPFAARRDRLDLMHCTSNIAPLIRVCPTIVTIHDVIEFRRATFGDVKLGLRHRLSRMYRMSFMPFIARKADLIITDSFFSQKDISDALKVPLERIKTIYIGPPEKITWSVNSENDICGKYILALGALDRRKNIEVLLKAFSILKSEIKTDLKLVIVGIEDLDIFRQKTSLNSHEFEMDIVCRGFVSDNELVALYQGCACFVYPSLYEGFGIPPLEAMAAGAPVIASKTTSVGEVVGEAGLLFDPDCPEELAKKIESVLENDELADLMKAKGTERLKVFSWEKCARKTFNMYKEVYEYMLER